MLPGVPEPTPDMLKKLTEKNLLVDALGSEGQQIVVVGDTSTGKSTTINFLLGYPINFEARGIGTRRPCIISQVQDDACDEVQYQVKFFKGKEPINTVFTDIDQVASCVTRANDAQNYPQYFEMLVTDPKADLDTVFDMTPINVTMKHKDFKYGLRLIDLPGLVRNIQGPMEIAKKYIQPGNITILVMGRDGPQNGGFPDLAERMSGCSQVLFVQNFAKERLQSGFAEENFEYIRKKYLDLAQKGNEGAGKLASNMKFYMCDFGYPCTRDFKEKGVWKEGVDQQNWAELAQKGCDVVQKAMYDHAGKWSENIQAEFAPTMTKMGFGAGVAQILCKIVEYQFEDIDSKILEYKQRCNQMIDEQNALFTQLTDKCRTLDDPQEWQALISKAALVVSEFMDTTIAVPEEDPDGELRDVVNCLKTVDQEPGLPDDFETENEQVYGPAKRSWFNDETDKAIRKLLHDETGFEVDKPLACLRSWYRLLDELIGMLAFAPMPYINKGDKLHIEKRVDQGMAATTNKMDSMVTLVANLDGKYSTGIRSLILQFARRLTRLAQRDLTNAMTMFAKFDKYNAVSTFLELVDDRSPESRKDLLNTIQEVILDHMKETLETTVCGQWDYDADGKKVEDPVTGYPLRKAKSGICVYQHPERGEGPPHWLLPFKGHYFNGQIPWRDLRLGPQFVDPVLDMSKVKPPQPMTPALEGEVHDNNSMNASNLVNLQIYKLCTEMYPISISISSPALDYSLEVMKLLKAMQGEVASFWKSSYISLIQTIKSEENIREYVKKQLKQELKEAKMVIELQNLDDWGRGFLGKHQAVDSISRSLSDFSFPDELKKTTRAELEAAAADLSRTNRDLLKSLPTEELSWPGISNNTYFTVIGQATGAPGMGGFPADSGTPMIGDAALKRLCEEFSYVMLQLSMKPVTDSELAMAKASRGKQLIESPQEIITKMVCHRLASLGQDAGIIWKYRFIYLFKVMMLHGLDDYLRRKSGARGAAAADGLPEVSGMKGEEWLKKTCEAYVTSHVDDMRGRLAQKFDELTPFDWTTLNGRFPFGGRKPIRKDCFIIKQGDMRVEAEKVDERVVSRDLNEQWNFPLRYSFKDLMDPEKKFLLVKNEEQGEGISLDDATNNRCLQTLDDRGCENAINLAMNAPEVEPPGGKRELAGGPFHEMALRVHKSMVANAIDYCKPRLKFMMAQMYKEENLREALNRSTKLDYKARYGKLVEKKRKELGDCEARRAELQLTLDILDGKKVQTKTGEVDQAALAAKWDKQAKAELAANEEMEKKLASLKSAENQTATDLATLEAQNAAFKADLKKYVACEQLSCWSLSINSIELNKLPSPGEGASIIVQGFYFQQPGWNGREIKKSITVPDTKTVMPYQWLFSCDPKEYEPGRALEWKVEDLYCNPTGYGLAGLKIPAVYPLQEYCLAVEVKALVGGKKKGFFGGSEEAKEVKLFTVALPLAYALRDKDTIFQKLEQIQTFGPLHRLQSGDCNGAFRMEERSRGSAEKQWRFIYEENMKHLGMDTPAARDAVLQIMVSQKEERQLSAAAMPAAPSGGGFKPPSRTGFKPGDKVEYFSEKRNSWFPAQIVKQFDEEHYEISLKPGERIAKKHLREPTAA